jgi:colicin import membrane protein
MATQTEVDAACEAIAARGERPTVERVRVELGGGSPNALTPMVRAWKEARQQPHADVQQVGIHADPVPLPAAIQRVLDGMSAAVAGLAPAFGMAIAEVAEAERRRSRLEVDAAMARARAEVEEARLAVQDERETTEAVRNEVVEQEQAMVAKDQEIDRLTGLLAERDHALAALTTEAAVARQAAAGERLRAERAEAEADRLRQERADGETAVREAIARAAKAEGEVAALRAEQAAAAAPQPRRSRKVK